ncbi:MAG TPA: hypothetical protein VM347_30805 [Nonomuraea sp.]|nr:hypothetical protein [Nonomuraea sp.]
MALNVRALSAACHRLSTAARRRSSSVPPLIGDLVPLTRTGVANGLNNVARTFGPEQRLHRRGLHHPVLAGRRVTLGDNQWLSACRFCCWITRSACRFHSRMRRLIPTGDTSRPVKFAQDAQPATAPDEVVLFDLRERQMRGKAALTVGASR